MKILVTGSSNGLGMEIAETLSALSAHSVVSYDIEYGYDVSSPTGLEGADIDCLINCAGVNKPNWIESMTPVEFDTTMAVNVKGIFMMSKAVLPSMLARREGLIINIISDAAQRPMRCSLAYNASKAAAHMMTLQMARELTSKGIVVMGISPGRLKGTAMSAEVTERVSSLRGWTAEEAQRHQDEQLLNGELPPHVIADYLCYLLSNKSHYKYLSGCIIPFGG